jgi:hypothetical protein
MRDDENYILGLKNGPLDTANKNINSKIKQDMVHKSTGYFFARGFVSSTEWSRRKKLKLSQKRLNSFRKVNEINFIFFCLRPDLGRYS